MSRSRKRKTSLFAAEVGLAGMHTFMTLWYRLPMFAAGMAPSELGRMVSERPPRRSRVCGMLKSKRCASPAKPQPDGFSSTTSRAHQPISLPRDYGRRSAA
jgi:hypothetical protein